MVPGRRLRHFAVVVWCFVFAHGWMYRLHSRWFHRSEEHFDGIHYTGMAIYKIGILLFNLAPYVVLRIMASHGVG